MKMFKGCLTLVGAAVAVIIVIVIIISVSGGGGDDKSKDTAGGSASSATSSPDSGSSEKATPAPAKPAMKVRAAKILKDFDENEAAADAKYSGKHMRITGIVEKVDTEFIDDNQYVVEIGGGGDFEIVFVNCDDQSPSVAAKVKKGDKVTVVADFEDGGDLGVELENCKLVS